ncbi:MAG TPA: LacI family DNA-binding transcriptional regulator [Terriglobia bacterium]|nr:LacI family DNA-binding transcriptional regulator [Terriglobia bacterium]
MNSKRVRQHKSLKEPNIHAVAQRAGVSVFTVSSVINKKAHVSTPLRRKVEEAIRELNYRPNLLARSLAKRQTHTIGVVVPDIANPFFPLIVRGVEDEAQKAGYSILLCNSDNQLEKEEQYLELLLSKRVDGILLTKAPGSLAHSLCHVLCATKVPCVLVMRTCRDLKADAVLSDDFQGAFEAVSHLVRQGYRRIGLVGGPLNVSNGRARWQGFRKALRVGGLPQCQDLIVEGDYRIESGYRAGLALLPRRPDAVYVANYLMTVGLMKAAEEMGVRCPEDFGLVSFDDYPWLGCFHPRLTTVDLPKYDVGAEATRILIERIKGKSGRFVIKKLPPQLVVRESCGFTHRMRGSMEPQQVQQMSCVPKEADIPGT